MVFHAVCATVEIVFQMEDMVDAMEPITEETVAEIAERAELTVVLIADQTEEKKLEIPPQMEEIVDAMAEHAELTVVLIAAQTEEKKLEIPPQTDEIVDEIAEQAELTVLVIPAHADEKKDAMLFHVFWKNDAIDDHTASQLVPNHPQKVSSIPVMIFSAA